MVLKRRLEPFQSEWAPWSMATVHPSSILRMPDDESRHSAWADFVDDMPAVADEYQRSG